MRQKSNFLIGIVFLMILTVLFSQNTFSIENAPPETTNINVFNPNNPQNFDYINGDYSTITDWSQVDWGKIPLYKIEKVPAEEIKYNELNKNQKLAMNSEQITHNFDNIENLNGDVDKFQAMKAIKDKYGTDISFYSDIGVQIKNDVIEATNGIKDRVNLKNPSYKSGDLNILSNGRILFKPKGLEKLDISDSESLEIGAIHGPDYELIPIEINGNIVAGAIKFDQGQAYIVDEDDLTINGVSIASWYFSEDKKLDPQKTRINIYFDSEVHEGSYISLDKEKRKIFVSSEDKHNSIRVEIKPDNEYIKIDEESKNTFLEFRVKSGSFLVEERENNLIPAVFAKPDKNNELNVGINNGKNTLTLINDKSFSRLSPYKKEDSVPLSLTILDKNGNNVLGGNEKKKIIFDGHNNFISLSENFAKNFENKGTNINLANDRLMFDYAGSKLKKYDIELTGKSTKNNVVLAKVAEYLDTLPPKMLENLDEIEIIPEADYNDRILVSKGAGGHARFHSITIKEELLEPTLFRHEVTHIHTLKVVGDDNKKFLDFNRFKKKLSDKYWQAEIDVDPQSGEVYATHSSGRSVDIDDEDKNKLVELARNAKMVRVAPGRLKQNNFKREWLDAAGDESDNLGDEGLGFAGITLYPTVWKDKTTGPKAGFMVPYGANRLIGPISWMEDPSTFIENFASKNYDGYREVTNPKSNFYQEQMGKPVFQGLPVGEDNPVMTPELANEWSTKYKKKLELLYKYEYIDHQEWATLWQEKDTMLAKK